MRANPQRVVFDCNVFVPALINRAGPAGKCVVHALNGDVALFLSDETLAEIRKAPGKATPARLGVTVERTETLIDNLLKVASVIPNVPAVFVYDRDPDDAHYVNLAVAAQAKLIVSRDRDLLDLMDARRVESLAFRRQFPAMRILDPVQLIRELETGE
jgi:putative PIN family toxin of toxin-antitoxin system